MLNWNFAAHMWVGWPKWLKSLGTAGTSAFPILFTKLFWKMAKKFKNFGALGCLIAVEEMADFTLWFQQKYDFFGTSSVLTPLVALKTQPNLWKQLSICQCISQGPKITKFELLEGFLALGMTIINRVNGVKNWLLAVSAKLWSKWPYVVFLVTFCDPSCVLLYVWRLAHIWVWIWSHRMGGK